MGCHDEGTESRTERQGIDGGDTYCHRHGQTELGIERTGGAAHEAHGDEHCHKHQRGGNDGCRDAAHGIDGCLVGRLITFVELGLHCLDHHNGIVHHSTDNQHQGK